MIRVWHIPGYLGNARCIESPTSMMSRSRMSRMAIRCSTSRSGRGSHTFTSAAPRGAAQPAASRSWMGSLGPQPDRAKRGWDEFTRLACQTKVHGAVVIRRLLDNPQDIIVLDLDELHGVAAGEGKELELAILFSDIRNFAAHSEKNLPVLNNNGFIDKYIGDGILAAFGTRDESPASTCRNAVRAALGMQDAAQRLCPDIEHEFNMTLRIGIGIHFGTAILGRIGHPGKRQITVIGDTVNMAVV
jgi:hypothetical protein